MIKPNNRKVSTCIYMAAISINDNVMMCLAIHRWLIGTGVHKLKSLECNISAYLVSVTLQNASFQVLAMTVDRYIAIKWPHKAAVYNTPKRALISITVIYICVIIFNLPNTFFSKLIGNECVGYVTGGIVAKVHAWFSLTLNALIPFSLLIYMNSVIVQQVRKSRKLFTNKESSVEDTNKTPNDYSQRRQNAMENAEIQLTIMLLLVTTLFLILMTPVYARGLYLLFVTFDTAFGYANLRLLFQASHKLYNTNSGINFFLYCVSGGKFRNDLKEMLCCSGGTGGLSNKSRDNI